MRRRSNLTLYLLLNIIVSALTTLAVIMIWNATHSPAAQIAGLPPMPTVSAAQMVEGPTEPPAPSQPAPTAGPTETDLPADAQVIQILSVVGVGDLKQEVVLLKRLGEGNLRMAGWKLQGENKNAYIFPDQPELILYKDGAVQVYSQAGSDTATDVYWNRSEPAWRAGETIKLIDSEGRERAVYRVP